MRRMIDFGIKGYTQGLIILPYGGMVNRLVAGNQFTAIQVALFGLHSPSSTSCSATCRPSSSTA